jgi:hypothetical protein
MGHPCVPAPLIRQVPLARTGESDPLLGHDPLIWCLTAPFHVQTVVMLATGISFVELKKRCWLWLLLYL